MSTNSARLQEKMELTSPTKSAASHRIGLSLLPQVAKAAVPSHRTRAAFPPIAGLHRKLGAKVVRPRKDGAQRGLSAASQRRKTHDAMWHRGQSPWPVRRLAGKTRRGG